MFRKIIVFILSFSFVNSVLWGQEKQGEEGESEPKYDFIRNNDNILQLYDSSSLTHFFEALYELEKEKDRKVRIVHIGDSHIQADFFSGETRKLLQNDQRFGNGGRGFVFPYSAAHTNNPFDYKTTYTGSWEGKSSLKRNVSSRWGLSGWTSITNSFNSTIKIRLLEDYKDFEASPSNHIKIYYPVMDSLSFNVSLLTENDNILSRFTSREGYVEFELKEPLTEFAIGLNKSKQNQNRFVMQGLYLENDQAGVVYSSFGVNGAKTDTYFRCEDFETHLKSLSPDLVVISLGTNDAYMTNFNAQTYEQNMLALINKVKEASPEASILVTSSGDNYRYKRYTNKNNAKVQSKLLKLLQERKLALWDFYQVMGGLGSINKWYAKGLARRDKIHLSQRGYTLQGKLFFDAIIKTYQQFVKKKQAHLGSN